MPSQLRGRCVVHDADTVWPGWIVDDDNVSDPVEARHGLSPGCVTPNAGTGPDSITTLAVAASPAVANRRERDPPNLLRRADGPAAEPLIN
jgi:hypothetical protein